MSSTVTSQDAHAMRFRRAIRYAEDLMKQWIHAAPRIRVLVVAVTIGVTATLVSASSVIWHGRLVQQSIAVVTVDGLTCSLCARQLEDSITQVSGVKSVTVDLGRQAAELTFDQGATVSGDSIVVAVRDAGFDPLRVEWDKRLDEFPILTGLMIHGRYSTACAEGVQHRLRAVPGVRSVAANPDKMVVIYDSRRTSAQTLARAEREARTRHDSWGCDTRQRQ